MERCRGVPVLILAWLGYVAAYHDIGNSGPMADSKFHCWPSDGSNTAYNECPGLEMHWVIPPPEEIKIGDGFNMTYSMELKPNFWNWAVNNGAFDHVNMTTASEAEEWCNNATCLDVPTIDKYHCCIYHVNVHSCPLATNSFCGPWIPSDGALYTHSTVMVGPISRGHWSSTVGGLYVEGETELIAHFKIGHVQSTLYTYITAIPRAVCGDDLCEDYEGEDCSNCPADCGTCPLPIYAVALITLFSCIFVFTIGGMFTYFRYKAQKMLYDESWIIPAEQIQPDNVTRGFMGSAISVAASGDESEGDNKLNMQAATKQVFCKTAIVNSHTVAIRKISRKSDFHLTKDVRQEVKAVRMIEHTNLAKFMGACIEVPDMAVCTEYCPKGSLQDVLLNEDVPLNWGFRFSFAADIARGIRQLHNNGFVHGHLTSNNCIVDDRWTLKVTDYGLPLMREEEREEEEEDEYKWKLERQAIYRGPESLYPGYKLLPSGDVYAIAMILIEIAIRNDPCGEEDDDKAGLAGYKPQLPKHDDPSPDDRCPCAEEYNTLITSCWNNYPDERPDIESVKKTLSKINPSKLSPIDLMMGMMEKYSKHLESIVADRTADLTLEKLKTDRLLYSMLPQAVADDLRQGVEIKACMYDGCTIFFSDIVGFTSLSGRSTPFQVVDLLNKLYICFDSIIDQYDLYKVETIGDAYMVVSGVPTKNGNLHAREISNMSLDLVQACLTFEIPHMPGEPLKIRCGNHTGPVCAGVVGLKMPRYCLFGDTVNTASRMESNGEEYKVHQSNFTYEALQQIGGFKHSLRGSMAIKGKGEMKTWWLLGREEEDIADRIISAESDSGFGKEDHREQPELPGVPEGT